MWRARASSASRRCFQPAGPAASLTRLPPFANIGRAYLAFARAEPAYYAAMFESGLPPDINVELRAAGDRAFGVLRTAAETLVGLLPAGKRPPALMMSLHVWSLSHGIASLFGRGDAGRRSLPMTAEELLESAMLIYLQGLGFPQKHKVHSPPLDSVRGMPNVNVVNIYIVNIKLRGSPHGPDRKNRRPR